VRSSGAADTRIYCECNTAACAIVSRILRAVPTDFFTSEGKLAIWFEPLTVIPSLLGGPGWATVNVGRLGEFVSLGAVKFSALFFDAHSCRGKSLALGSNETRTYLHEPIH